MQPDAFGDLFPTVDAQNTAAEDLRQQQMKSVIGLVRSLRSSVTQTAQSAENNVKEKRSQNEELLHEINCLRGEVCSIYCLYLCMPVVEMTRLVSVVLDITCSDV